MLERRFQRFGDGLGIDTGFVYTTAMSSGLEFGEALDLPTDYGIAEVARRLEEVDEGNRASRRRRRRQLMKLRRAGRRCLPGSRIEVCGKLLRVDRMPSEGVTIMKAPDGACFYKGLMHCGSVWICPVCSAAISEVRRGEVMAAVRTHQRRGGGMLFLTLTIEHGREEPLKQVLGRLKRAVRSFFNSRTWRNLSRCYDFGMRVRSVEVTWGAHGWHVHQHILIFVGVCPEVEAVVREAKVWREGDRVWHRPAGAAWDATFESHDLTWRIGDELSEAWSAACASADGFANRRGLDLLSVDTQGVGAYVGTWGPDRELVKADAKRARGGNMTPWEILQRFDEAEDERSAARWRALFQEYAAAMHGTKLLLWTKGTKENLGVREVDEQEIAEQAERQEGAIEIGTIPAPQWVDILHAGAEALVLDIAEVQGWPGVCSFLMRLNSASRVPG